MITGPVSEFLATYSADLEYAQHLSEEEQRALIAAAAERGSSLDREARNRLLEEYLALAKNLAIKRCPRAYFYLLPEMIGEINLTLVQAMERYDVQKEGKVSTYLLSFVDGAIRKTILRRRIITIPSSTIHDATQRGTHKRLFQFELVSLEEHLQSLEVEADEIVLRPLLPTQALPEGNAQQRARLEGWLAHLPARDERVVRMFYGLVEGDERSYNTAEIARALGLTYQATRSALTSSLLRLRQLAQGTARFRQKEGRQVVKGIFHGHALPVLTSEQEKRLLQAAQDLCTQGMTISMRTLTKASRLSNLHARAFLQQHRHEFPPEYLPGTDERRQRRQRERMEHVGQVYQQFLDEGRPIIEKHLARCAHEHPATVRAFLRAREQAQTASMTDDKMTESPGPS